MLVSVVWRALRLARQHAQTESVEYVRDEAHGSGTTAQFRRDDFAAKAEIINKQKMRGAIPVLFFGGVAAIYALQSTLSREASIVALAIVVAVAVGWNQLFLRRARRLARSSGLKCHACGMELVGQTGRVWIDDYVLETGKCPGCEAQLLDPSDVRPIPDPKDGSRTRIIVRVVVIAMLVALLYYVITPL
jgi:hypothetical protein